MLLHALWWSPTQTVQAAKIHWHLLYTSQSLPKSSLSMSGDTDTLVAIGWVTGHFGWTQDTLDLRHFGPKNVCPKCPDTSVPGPKYLGTIQTWVRNVSRHFRPGSEVSCAFSGNRQLGGTFGLRYVWKWTHCASLYKLLAVGPCYAADRRTTRPMYSNLK